MTMTDDETDGLLGNLLDEGGDWVALMTLSELKVARYGLYMIGLGDGPGAEAARELVGRIDRRARVQWPDENMTLPGYGWQYN